MYSYIYAQNVLLPGELTAKQLSYIAAYEGYYIECNCVIIVIDTYAKYTIKCKKHY